MAGNLKVALYARVSTLNNGQSPEMQLRELREYCQRRDWIIVGEYVDAGISGAKDSRPELNRLMADAHKRRFDVVCVWKFDRFARSARHLLLMLEECRHRGIQYVGVPQFEEFGQEVSAQITAAIDGQESVATALSKSQQIAQQAVIQAGLKSG